MASVKTFYDTLPRHSAFEELSDPSLFAPLPDDWVVGLADIVGSTKAIAEGQYKTVNMVGAAVISAQINGFGGRAFPYVFGGDGAVFACAPEDASQAAHALAAVQNWAKEQFDIDLRAAMIPVSDIRTAGRDVLVARFQASDDVDYAMFSGGGVSWAETEMKAGRIALPPLTESAQPDLTGLSCRWSPVQARNGVIASLVVEPRDGAPGAAFSALAERVIALVGTLDRAGHPIPPEGAEANWPPPGMEMEMKVTNLDKPLWRRRIGLTLETLMAWFFFKTDIPLASFKPSQYRADVGRNADFRKFEDGLKMTLDADQATLDALRDILEESKSAGIIDYGLFLQDQAMMTCIVPSVMQKDHVHFVDGAAGGYASAAAQMKASRG
ncbi:MAG: DUF3095 domain-containing protein [Arenibacterium sp.]